MSRYIWSGVHPFVDSANTANHSLPPAAVNAAKGQKALKDAAQALTWAIDGAAAGAGHQNALIANAVLQRNILALAIDSVEQAIQAVVSHYGLTAVTFAKETGEV